MRDLILGNGNILLGLDGELCLRDFYYPYVGMNNHVGGQRCRVGVWAEGHFQWVERYTWQIRPGYVPGSLVADSSAQSANLGLRLRIREGVHFRDNLYLRRITLQNQLGTAREVRLFLAHDFSINETAGDDTAFLDPATRAIIHYERGAYFLINGGRSVDSSQLTVDSREGDPSQLSTVNCQLSTGSEATSGISEFATGIKGFAWAEGTWRDAEDGHLQGNPVAQGSVDSTIAFHVSLPPNGEETINVWIAVGDGLEAVRQADEQVRRRTVERLLEETTAFWRSWLLGAQSSGLRAQGSGPGVDLPRALSPEPRAVSGSAATTGDLPAGVTDLFQRSLLIVRAQMDNEGAVIASTDSEHLQAHRDTYTYVWPRDGAFAALALDQLGYSDVTRRFFQFCARRISPEGYLWHKYFADGSVGPSWHPWVIDGRPALPIPEDETALVLHAFWRHYCRYNDIEFAEALYGKLVRPAAEFLLRHRDPQTRLPLPSWDVWEERYGVFTFTAATVNAGLTAAASFARQLGAGEDAARYAAGAIETRAAIEQQFYDERLGRFVRQVFPQADGSVTRDETLDSSLVGLFAFGLLPAEDARVIRTMEALSEGLRIQTEIGGIARYTGDGGPRQGSDATIVPGNPWPICTLWLSQWQIARAYSFTDLRTAAAAGIEWASRHATHTGLLPEQVHPYNGQPLSVCPLTGSHVAFVTTILQYIEKLAVVRQHAKIGNGHGAVERQAVDIRRA
jgi:GH15 family glucan-1,4-alpha-glucosidase